MQTDVVYPVQHRELIYFSLIVFDINIEYIYLYIIIYYYI